jgi:hypothetical protein
VGAEFDLMRAIVRAWEGVDATAVPEAFTRANWIDPQIRLEMGAIGLPDEDDWVGQDEVDRGWQRWLSQWNDYRLTGSNLEQHGSHILVDLHVEAVGRGSRAPVSIDHVQVWTWHEGMVTRIRAFANRGSALEAISQEAPDDAGDPRTPQAR